MEIDIIGVTNLPKDKGVLRFLESAKRHNLEVNLIVTPWQGFFTKVDQAYEHSKNTYADYILFVDTHDVVFVDNLDRLKSRIIELGSPDAIFSTEKACWPDATKAEEYPKNNDFEFTQWKYLNSGSYLATPRFIIDSVEEKPPVIGIDDQLYWTEHYLAYQELPFPYMELDHKCELFQTLAHDDGSSFGVVDGKFTNKITNTNPIVVHGNGRAMDEFDYSYLDKI